MLKKTACNAEWGCRKNGESEWVKVISIEKTGRVVNENMKEKAQRIKAYGCLNQFYLPAAQNIYKFKKSPKHKT